MKQIYTLLAAAFISTAAYAGVNPLVRYEAKRLTNVDLKELIAKQGVESKAILPQGMQRILNQSDNSEWASMVAIQAKLTDVYSLSNNGTPITFEQFPFYDMIVSMQPMGADAKAFYPLEILWPAYGALDKELRDDATGAVDVEACKAKWGEKAFQPYTYEDFVEANGGDGKILTMPGFYQMPCILGPEALTDDRGTYMGVACSNADGKTCYPKSAEIIGSGDDARIDYADATVLDWRNFDMDTSSVQLVLDGKFSSTVGGPTTTTVNADLVGECVVLGFKDIEWDTIGEVHIFNGGPQEYGTGEWTWNYENAFEGTLNFYYLAMCDETWTYNGVDQQGKELRNYTEEDLPADGDGTKITYGAPSWVIGQDTPHHIFMAGALWAPENAKPYGRWTMKTPEIVRDGNSAHYAQAPEAYNLVVYGNTEDGTRDGLHGSYEGYIQVGVPESCFIGIGDKNNGLNFLFGTSLNFGHYIYGTYKGDIYYHGTPGKWVSDITKLPAVADEDADFVGEWSGIESVVEESNAPVVSRSFYNFQGQRLSSEPENGMYIIRSVKADGTVKAEKVAK